MHFKTLAAATAILLCALPAVSQARDSALYLPFEQVVNEAISSGKIDGSVKFYLAGEALPTQVHKLKAVSSSRRADDNEDKSAEDTCYWALQSTLATLQSKAKKAGANAVINIAGINKRDLSQDTGKYQCSDDEEIPGLEALKAVVSGVALRGDLVRVD